MPCSLVAEPFSHVFKAVRCIRCRSRCLDAGFPSPHSQPTSQEQGGAEGMGIGSAGILALKAQLDLLSLLRAANLSLKPAPQAHSLHLESRDPKPFTCYRMKVVGHVDASFKMLLHARLASDSMSERISGPLILRHSSMISIR